MRSNKILITVVTLALAAMLASCSMVPFLKDGVSNPMTPEEARAQVVDAARDIAHTLDIEGMRAGFRRVSCNDQGEAPFRGKVEMFYPLADSFEQAADELAEHLQRLQAGGWSTDSDFRSHGATIEKNGVTVVFYSQNVSTPSRHITVFGECRDVTTSENGSTEDISLEP